VAAVAPVRVEVGGGLRDIAAVESVLESGAGWVVVGTRAALDERFLRDVCRRFPARVIIAVDARGARVAVKGWAEVGGRRGRGVPRGRLAAGRDACRRARGLACWPSASSRASTSRTAAW